MEFLKRTDPHLIVLFLLAGEGDVVGHRFDLKHELTLIGCLIYFYDFRIYSREQIFRDLILRVVIVEEADIGKYAELFTPSFEP